MFNDQKPLLNQISLDTFKTIYGDKPDGESVVYYDAKADFPKGMDWVKENIIDPSVEHLPE